MTGFAELRDLEPRQIFQAGQDLQRISQRQFQGHTDYLPRVVLPVQAGEIWLDDAQPDGAAVVDVMGRSFDTSSALMTSAALTCVTLSTELEAAKRALLATVEKAQTIGFVVDDDGKVRPGEEQKRVAEMQKRNGSPVAGQLENILYNEAESWEKLIGVAVGRASNADGRCSALLREVAYKTLPMTKVADPAIIAAAKGENERAYQLYGMAAQLPKELQDAAAKALEEAQRLDPVAEFVVGVFKGLWSGIAGFYSTVFTIGALPVEGTRALAGDEQARRNLDILGTQLSNMNLGDLIALDDLKAGRYGEFLGKNAWWFVPMSKGATLAGKGTVEMTRLARVSLADARAAMNAGRGGHAPVPGQQWSGSGRTSQQLADAGQAPAKGGVPRSVQEMDKHATGQRGSGTKFPPLSGGPADKLATAQRTLGEIVTNPGTREVPITAGKFKGGHYYVSPDGRGAAYDTSGNFQYFGEFTYPG